MSQNQKNHWITLDHELIECKIKRIDDETYWTLVKHSLCVSECSPTWWNDVRDSDNEQFKATPLAFMMVAFENAYGSSGALFDRYKGAFSFPFAVKILRDDTVIPYLLHVTCWRGSVEFRFSKIIPVDETQYDIKFIHAPFDGELSNRQMNLLANFLLGFAEGFWISTQRNEDMWAGPFPEEKQPDFVRAIDSNGILFGRKDGCLFELYYSDQDEYEKTKKELLTPYQQSLFEKRLRETFFDE